MYVSLQPFSSNDTNVKSEIFEMCYLNCLKCGRLPRYLYVCILEFILELREGGSGSSRVWMIGTLNLLTACDLPLMQPFSMAS